VKLPVTTSLRRPDTANAKPFLGTRERERLLEQLRDCAEGLGGEVSARSRAARLGQTYLQLSDAARHEFLRLIALQVYSQKVICQANRP